MILRDPWVVWARRCALTAFVREWRPQRFGRWLLTRH